MGFINSRKDKYIILGVEPTIKKKKKSKKEKADAEDTLNTTPELTQNINESASTEKKKKSKKNKGADFFIIKL